MKVTTIIVTEHRFQVREFHGTMFDGLYETYVERDHGTYDTEAAAISCLDRVVADLWASGIAEWGPASSAKNPLRVQLEGVRGRTRGRDIHVVIWKEEKELSRTESIEE
jgi:hypothetical protein